MMSRDEHFPTRGFSSADEELDWSLDRFQDANFVLKSTGIRMFIYEGLERRGFDVALAHPLKARAMAEARVKMGKADAETQAQLLRPNLIPHSWIPSKDMRDLRLLRHKVGKVVVHDHFVKRNSDRWRIPAILVPRCNVEER